LGDRTPSRYNSCVPRIDKHTPGGFCWIELATTDQNAAKTFYGSLFGWAAVDFPMGPSEFYTMFKVQQRDAAAAYSLRAEQRSEGIPSHWMLYIAVEDADATSARATEAGGKVLAPAFDVMTFGRMAVLQDPAGAIFSVWQPKTHIGTGVSGEDGTLCWADLSTPDPGRAARFYSDLFGWKIASAAHDPSGYLHIQNGAEFIGGIPPAAHRNPQVPPHWLVYFAVADVDACATVAKQQGGRELLPAVTTENVGRIAILSDPQGAAFAIFKSARG
jgi:predicted enzyme related to lactoylglutathione lyase